MSKHFSSNYNIRTSGESIEVVEKSTGEITEIYPASDIDHVKDGTIYFKEEPDLPEATERASEEEREYYKVAKEKLEADMERDRDSSSNSDLDFGGYEPDEESMSEYYEERNAERAEYLLEKARTRNFEELRKHIDGIDFLNDEETEELLFKLFVDKYNNKHKYRAEFEQKKYIFTIMDKKHVVLFRPGSKDNVNCEDRSKLKIDYKFEIDDIEAIELDFKCFDSKTPYIKFHFWTGRFANNDSWKELGELNAKNPANIKKDLTKDKYHDIFY
ncbi:MAG: hypothetical protein KKB03_04280 [Nanoarchaeota archaeon]|nr:hypothetical protein [Nanoarchaeota archaeon]MBU2520431.1 hypothetical protein [Nanoarchaeota archaeon]